MQLREGGFAGERPVCPRHPECRLHRHGSYTRYEGCDGDKRMTVARFYCRACGATFSVLPRQKLPYIAPTTWLLETHFDAFGSGGDPPPASEKERGCLWRAWKRLASRIEPLRAMFGQMIGAIKPSVSELWKQIRQTDNLEGILLFLARTFNSSLLGDYRCLRGQIANGRVLRTKAIGAKEGDPTQPCCFFGTKGAAGSPAL